VLFQHLDRVADRRVLLADGHVEALHAGGLLIENRVDGDRRFARFAVADDQLALAAADGRHRVDRLDTRLQRLLHRLAAGHAGGHELDGAVLGAGHRALAVERVAQRIDDAADHCRPDGHRQQLAQRLDLVAFLNRQVVAENRHANAVFLQVERHADGPVGELDHLAGHHVRQAVDAGDSIAHLQHRAHFLDADRVVVFLDLRLNDGGNFGCVEFHNMSLVTCHWSFVFGRLHFLFLANDK
jgi:hypothetical protein